MEKHAIVQRPPLPRGGCRRRRLGEKSPPQRLASPERGGGICEANDGEVFKTATFKPLSHGFAVTAPLCKGSLWVLCLIVFCFSCILAEKFSFQREDGEYSDLRSGNVAFPRPRPTFSWSPTMAPFRANGCPFLAAASRAQLRANGLKTFVLSSPAQYRKSARDRELHVFRCV